VKKILLYTSPHSAMLAYLLIPKQSAPTASRVGFARTRLRVKDYHRIVEDGNERQGRTAL